MPKAGKTNTAQLLYEAMKLIEAASACAGMPNGSADILLESAHRRCLYVRTALVAKAAA